METQPVHSVVYRLSGFIAMICQFCSVAEVLGGAWIFGSLENAHSRDTLLCY